VFPAADDGGAIAIRWLESSGPAGPSGRDLVHFEYAAYAAGGGAEIDVRRIELVREP
jgi:hypothetical protein